MKKLLSFLLMSLPALAAQSQGTDSSVTMINGTGVTASNTVLHKLKSNDQVLPRWAVDLNYRVGWLSQTMETIDMKTAYGPNNLNTSRYVQPTFSNGTGNGAELLLSYYFNRRRRVGGGMGGPDVGCRGVF